MAETTSLVTHYGWDKERFLQDLPPPVRRYIYEGKEQFHEIIEQNAVRHYEYKPEDGVDFTQYIIFLIDPASFERECLNQESSLIAHQSYSYDYTTHILIVKMKITPEHEEALVQFSEVIKESLRAMGFKTRVAGSEIWGGQGVDVSQNQTKKPDWGWSPRDSKFESPTIVLEVAVSETETKLRNDARMWVDPTRGRAQTAITVKVDRRKPELKFEMWEWVDSKARVTKQITIRRAGDRVEVSNPPLEIPFCSSETLLPLRDSVKPISC